MNVIILAVSLLVTTGSDIPNFQTRLEFRHGSGFVDRYVDPITECHYLVFKYDGRVAVFPRLKRDGSQMCGPYQKTPESSK